MMAAQYLLPGATAHAPYGFTPGGAARKGPIKAQITLLDAQGLTPQDYTGPRTRPARTIPEGPGRDKILQTLETFRLKHRVRKEKQVAFLEEKFGPDWKKLGKRLKDADEGLIGQMEDQLAAADERGDTALGQKLAEAVLKERARADRMSHHAGRRRPELLDEVSAAATEAAAWSSAETLRAALEDQEVRHAAREKRLADRLEQLETRLPRAAPQPPAPPPTSTTAPAAQAPPPKAAPAPQKEDSEDSSDDEPFNGGRMF